MPQTALAPPIIKPMNSHFGLQVSSLNVDPRHGSSEGDAVKVVGDVVKVVGEGI